MKLHFFTVNNIEDYRKNFPKEGVKVITPDVMPDEKDFDQVYLLAYLKKMFGSQFETAETKIFGETGIDGLRLDFNFGLRLDVPEGNFRVKISDFDTGEIFFDHYASGGRLISVEQYFIRWHVEIFLDEKKIFSHTLDLEGQPVAVVGKAGAIGDLVALLPYIAEFKKISGCKLSLCLPDYLREVAARLYPELPQVDEINFETYARYYPFMLLSSFPLTPADYRKVSLTRAGGMLFGINYLPPKNFFKPSAPPVTNDPYVCISVQASMARKSWLWPGGWDVVVSYLKSLGYRVFCIDKNAEEDNDGFKISMPEGAENFTGNRPLLERANMLAHAQFFIGLGSGLSWLADAVNCPVVLICGFSQDWSEFYTPYRVANRRVCNGCFNDPRVSYIIDKCPYHKDTPREFECQKKISPRMVIDTIEHLIIDKKLTPPALRSDLP